MSEYTLENLRRNNVHTCDEEYGYILEIHRIVRMLENKFSIYTGLLWMKCQVEATTLKPETNDEFTADIGSIKPVGIFGTVAGIMRCFVKPLETKVEEKKKKNNTTIKFKVLETRYKNGVYETVGMEV